MIFNQVAVRGSNSGEEPLQLLLELTPAEDFESIVLTDFFLGWLKSTKLVRHQNYGGTRQVLAIVTRRKKK
jgi:hypothetical protein